MSKTAAKYFNNYHAARRRSLLDRILDQLRRFQDWYCGVAKE